MTTKEDMLLTKYDLLFESRLSKAETTTEILISEIKEIKSDVKQMKNDMRTDFRWILGMMIALVGIMAKGFHWI